MKAVVMAGGEGSRLRPLTLQRPKPMMPLVNKSCIAHILDLLARHGVTEAVATLQYLAQDIRDRMGESYAGIEMHYAVEDVPLGTAGSVRNAISHIDDTFLVISGDALTDMDLTSLVSFHKEHGSVATLALYHAPNPLEYGVVITDEEGHVRQFQEKPSWGEVFSDTINTGIYVLSPEIFDLVPKDRPFDFSQDLFPMLLQQGAPIFGYVADGYWCDIGTIQEYQRATADILEGRVKIDLGEARQPGVWCGDFADIAPSAELSGPIYLGPGCKVREGAVIRGPSVVRAYSIIDRYAVLDRAIVWRNCYIGEGAQIRGAIVGRQCTVKAGAILGESSVLADACTVGAGASIAPGVKIWPAKEIVAGAVVKSSLVGGAVGRRELFGRFGVTGMANVELTPEFAARLGAAYGATLPVGSWVTMNRDPHRASRMIKRAMIAGLPSVGINVLDVKAVPLPVARYFTGASEAAGGVHIRVSPFENRTVDIKFFDRHGMDLSKAVQRKIESGYFREDVRRAFMNEIGIITDALQAGSVYTQGFLKAVDVQAIQNLDSNVIIDYAFSTAAQVLPEIMNRLGSDSIALNATVDESKMAISLDELQQGLSQLSAIVPVLKADLAARLDVSGEKVFFVDDRGTSLSPTTALAAMAVLAWRSSGGGTLAIPVTQPVIFERLAAQYGGKVERTRFDMGALMTAATQKDVILAGDGEGSYIFPSFASSPDALMAVAKLLESLAKARTRLSHVVWDLPGHFTERLRVACPWEAKASVMRQLNERYGEGAGPQVDGVRIEEGPGVWALILPEPDQPGFFIYAEGGSASEARSLADRYAALVGELRK
jgi:mannose-1-phosphate guanylyltransferase / phosphomannomutase